MSKIPTDAQWADLASKINGKQDALTAGTGIDITNNVISAAPLQFENGTASAVTVNTSWVTLKTINITNSGTFLVWAGATRSGNSSSGCLINMRIMKGTTTVSSSSAPTVANYAGNHEPLTTLVGVFSASSGDSITIDIKKDRTNYSAKLGCEYSITQVG